MLLSISCLVGRGEDKNFSYISQALVWFRCDDNDSKENGELVADHPFQTEVSYHVSLVILLPECLKIIIVIIC